MPSIKRFRAELNVKVERLESEFNSLAERMTSSELGSKEAVRRYLDSLVRRIARKLPIRMAAESVLNRRWGGSFDVHTIHSESQAIVSKRRRALAAMDIASISLDEAAHAAVEAWLAENGAGAGSTPESMEPKNANQ